MPPSPLLTPRSPRALPTLALALLLLHGLLLHGCSSQGLAVNEASDRAPAAVARGAAAKGPAGFADLAHESADMPTSQWDGDAGGGSLRAGDIDDNAALGAYLDYLARYRGGPVLPVDVSERVVVQVLDQRERPVIGAEVAVRADGGDVVARLRTHADGRAVLFPRADPGLAGATTLRLEAALGSARGSTTMTRGRDAGATVILGAAVAPPSPPSLELVFCLDATGSMGDEIARIQRTLIGVTRRIQALGALDARPRIRWGLVAYRDRGDAFVTRRWKLTADLAAFNRLLGGLTAAGGGDTPEALCAGLGRAVGDMDWRDPRALRLVFLVGDAGPQLDRQDEVPYPQTIALANQLGVKLYPIAASGLDPAGEYVFRQLAQQTLSRFVFISYGGTTPHQVGPYRENNLDDLIVDIVRRELAGRAGDATPVTPVAPTTPINPGAPGPDRPLAEPIR